MDAIKEAFSFKSGPKSLVAELISIIFYAGVFLALTVIFGDGGYKVTLYFMIGLVAATATRYVWWHFRPYKAPPPPPVTRYTNPRYTKH